MEGAFRFSLASPYLPIIQAPITSPGSQLRPVSGTNISFSLYAIYGMYLADTKSRVNDVFTVIGSQEPSCRLLRLL